MSRRIEGKADELGELFEAAGAAEVEYKVARARVLLSSERKTVAEREAEAEVQCERLLQARRNAEAVADAARESLRALRDQLTAVCSVGANLRAEMQMSGPQYTEKFSRAG